VQLNEFGEVWVASNDGYLLQYLTKTESAEGLTSAPYSRGGNSCYRWASKGQKRQELRLVGGVATHGQGPVRRLGVSYDSGSLIPSNQGFRTTTNVGRFKSMQRCDSCGRRRGTIGRDALAAIYLLT